MQAQSKTFTFELVSPERKLFSGPVRMVEIPGEEGDFGVLPGHSALVASIRPGVIRVTLAEGGEPRRVFVAGGFADVSPANCTVLSEEAVDVKDLDPAVLARDLKNLEEDLNLAKDDGARARIRRQIMLAQARLRAAA